MPTKVAAKRARLVKFKEIFKKLQIMVIVSKL